MEELYLYFEETPKFQEMKDEHTTIIERMYKEKDEVKKQTLKEEAINLGLKIKSLRRKF